MNDKVICLYGHVKILYRSYGSSGRGMIAFPMCSIGDEAWVDRE